jgi:Class III cytochrome C family
MGDSAALAEARANFELVEQGHGIHNVPYSLAVLSAAHHQLNEARRAAGLGALATPWAEAPYASPCLGCHAGSESQAGAVFGRRFSHRRHVVDSGIECLSCHSTHEERDAGGVPPLKLQAADCGACHHRDPAAECLDCHENLGERTFPVPDIGEFQHSIHVDELGIECETCHGDRRAPHRPDRAVCAECH